MGMVAFDTLKLYERLRAAGVPDEQAKAQAEAFAEALGEMMAERLATRQDLKDLRAGIDERLQALQAELRLIHERLEQTPTRAEMEKRFGQVEQRFGSLHAEMEKRFGSLQAEMERRFAEQLKWLAGMLIAQAGVIVALIKLIG